MTYSELKITFTEDFELNYILKIINNFSESEISTIWTEKWVNLRFSTNQVTLGAPTEIIGESAAIGFVNAFALDYNFPVQYEVTRIANEVTIKSMIPDQSFGSAEVTLNGDIIDVAEIEITNYVGVIYDVEEITFSTASGLDACTKIKVNIETTELTTKILSPFILEGNTENPFSFDAFRSQSIIVKCENSEGVQILIPIAIPDALNKDNFNLSPSNTPNGGVLVVEKQNSYGLDVEYSLDNSTWIEEPYFSGLDEGTHTLYVRDQFGCSFSVPFFVSEFGVQNAYFYYSKSNSIRMAERVDFEVIPKNDENTLSCESEAKLPYKEIQRFNSVDNITVQFKSNLEENSAKIIEEVTGTVTNLIVDKKTSNIGKKDKRDAIIYRYSKFKSGIYFTNGNTYDFDTNAINGDYILNGLLPSWAKAGNYIIIGSIWYLIEGIVYDESKNADVLIISKTVLFLYPESVIVGSIYNLQNYEVYETTIVMGGFNDKNIRLKIETTDPNFSSKTYLSEVINVQEKHEDCLAINDFNIDNNDVFYQTRIEHLIRLPFTKISGYFNDNSESNKTDSSVVLLNSTLYEGNEFLFEPVTKEIWRKLVIALSHKFVFIDGVGYVKDGEIEVEGPLEDTNLYVVKAKMLKTGNVYTDKSVGTIVLANDEVVDIPGMIEWDGGFIEQ